MNAVVGGSKYEAETRVGAMSRGGVMHRQVVGMRCEAWEYCLRRISWAAWAHAHPDARWPDTSAVHRRTSRGCGGAGI